MTPRNTDSKHRSDHLTAAFAAAVGAADPLAFVRDSVRSVQEDVHGGDVWILALGKAAARMARGASEALAEAGIAPAGGVVLSVPGVESPHPLLVAEAGDHPIPGPASARAARALRTAAGRVRAGDVVFVLLSGGASSLAAAPVDGLTTDDLAKLFALLHGSGLPIAEVNSVRKQVTRWGGGRLAASMPGATIRPIVLSDVIGDDASVVASGPCEADAGSASDAIAMLMIERLWPQLPSGIREYLHSVELGKRPDTVKPGDSRLLGVLPAIVRGNSDALEAAGRALRTRGVANVYVAESALEGEAATAGSRVVDSLLLLAAQGRGEPVAVVWGGETTVSLGADAGHPIGGRCQELALSAARALHSARPDSSELSLLAAGTDGRDGPTDAAGAIVDATTWDSIAHRGRDPADDLDAHRAHGALDAAGCLLRTGPTGTNVADIVIGLALR